MIDKILYFRECVGDCYLFNKWELAPMTCQALDITLSLISLFGILFFIFWLFQQFRTGCLK